MAPKYKITYFNVTALAEGMRWLLSYGGIEFEEHRFEHDEWPSIKPTMPFGQAPIMEIDGKVYNQSMAISRYLAKLVNLNGKNDLQAIEIDAMIDNINDLRLRISLFAYADDEGVKEKHYKTLINETLPYWLGKLDEIAKKNNGHLVLGELTWADIYFSSVLDYLNHMAKFNIIEKYPNLQKLNESVRNLPAIKAWIAKRPKTTF